jgi:hypothetical protein
MVSAELCGPDQRCRCQRHFDKEEDGVLKIITSAVACVAALILAPAADADPTSYYLACLSEHGVVVNNRNEAVSIGTRIQADLANKVPDAQIERNLVDGWNMQPSTARVEVECAGETLLAGR